MYTNEIIVELEATSSRIQVNRPKYDDLINAYKKVAGLKACEVFKLVHKDLYKYCQNKNPNYQNACATRISYAFNKGNYKIKLQKDFIDEKTGEPYILSVSKMIQFLEKEFGNSDIKFNGDIEDFKSKIKEKKGILIFEVLGWSDATGHITLWDGKACADGHCYFQHDNPIITTKNLIFWELK